MVEKVARLFDTTNACPVWEHLGAIGWIFILGEMISLELQESRLWLVTAVCMYSEQPAVMVDKKYS